MSTIATTEDDRTNAEEQMFRCSDETITKSGCLGGTDGLKEERERGEGPGGDRCQGRLLKFISSRGLRRSLSREETERIALNGGKMDCRRNGLFGLCKYDVAYCL